MINFVLKAAVSLSALLLFILQPLYAKHLLPYFGGAASVWTVTMFFFTCVLCVGYLYATWLMKDGARLRLVLHALLALVATVLVLYGWWRTGVPLFTAGIATSLPSVGVFLTLLSGVLFPVLLLASSAVVIQKLYSWHTGENPYPLYALSNAGSLFGLLSYPFLLERWVDGTTVVMWWSVGFGVYVFLLFFAIVLVQRRRRDTLLKERMRVTGSEAGLWTSRERAKVFLLSAVPALVLVALTEHVNQAVAGLPLLWVAPLALYLISFMVAYRGRGGVRSPVWAVVVGVVTMITLSLLLNPLTIAGGILIKGLVCGAGFLLICFWFHRQLYEQRPATQYLGQYYTLVTIGGVVGSVIVTFILPLALNTRPELFISLVGIALYCLWQGRNVLVGYFGPRVSVAVVVLSMAILLVQSLLAMGAGAVARERNFYGVLRVVDSETYVGEEVVKMRTLVSGSTLHGAEALDKEWQDRLLSYYSMSSGLGLLMQSVAERDERPRVAGVGLGVGVLNYYCEDLEQLDYIEINPAVYTLAQEYFTFLDRCPNHSGVTLGDGRTILEAWSRAGREYDMVIIDAFTDDAIPLHLLTTEAFERAYLPLLSQNGVLAFHVTNRHLELTPVVAGAAAQQGLHTLEIRSDEVKEGERAYRTTWVLIGTKQALAPLVNQGYELYGGKTILWTDTKSSILEVLDF